MSKNVGRLILLVQIRLLRALLERENIEVHSLSEDRLKSEPDAKLRELISTYSRLLRTPHST